MNSGSQRTLVMMTVQVAVAVVVVDVVALVLESTL